MKRELYDEVMGLLVHMRDELHITADVWERTKKVIEGLKEEGPASPPQSFKIYDPAVVGKVQAKDLKIGDHMIVVRDFAHNDSKFIKGQKFPVSDLSPPYYQLDMGEAKLRHRHIWFHESFDALIKGALDEIGNKIRVKTEFAYGCVFPVGKVYTVSRVDNSHIYVNSMGGTPYSIMRHHIQYFESAEDGVALTNVSHAKAREMIEETQSINYNFQTYRIKDRAMCVRDIMTDLGMMRAMDTVDIVRFDVASVATPNRNGFYEELRNVHFRDCENGIVHRLPAMQFHHCFRVK